LLGKEPKDTTAIKTKTEELNKEMQAIGTEIYQKAAQEAAKKKQGQASGTGQGAAGGASGPGQQGTGPGGKDEKVVDADYEVKDEKKKDEKDK